MERLYTEEELLIKFDEYVNTKGDESYQKELIKTVNEFLQSINSIKEITINKNFKIISVI